jgi:hypothetical protein
MSHSIDLFGYVVCVRNDLLMAGVVSITNKTDRVDRYVEGFSWFSFEALSELG